VYNFDHFNADYGLLYEHLNLRMGCAILSKGGVLAMQSVLAGIVPVRTLSFAHSNTPELYDSISVYDLV